MNQRIGPWLLLIALNAAMWLFFLRKEPETKARTSSAWVSPSSNKAAVVKVPAPIIVTTNTFNWEQLESEDYQTYIARLRDIGCPEQTIRDIVIADLEKMMAPRFQGIEGIKEPPKYWKPDRKELIRTLETLDKQEKKQEVDFEKREIVRELLGVDLAAERSRNQGENDFYEQRLTFLSPEKRSHVRMIMERSNREEIALREKSWLENDELTAEERKQLHDIQARKEQDIAAMLGPQELEEYDLWFSPSAYRVRDSFFAMDPSKEDFLAIYQIQREFDSQWEGRDTSTLDSSLKQQYEAAKTDYEQKIQAYLGEERYEDYRRSRDYDFQQLQASAAQFGLNLGVASEIYGFRKVLEEERGNVRRMEGLTSDQRDRVLAALAEEAEQAVVEVMGPKAYRYYKRNGAGKWIETK